jgi:hypothetical protein
MTSPEGHKAASNGNGQHLATGLNGNGHYIPLVTPKDRRGPLQYIWEESSPFEKIYPLLTVIALIGTATWMTLSPKASPTPEELRKAEQLDKIDTAIETLQNERDQIDPPVEYEPDPPGWP